MSLPTEAEKERLMYVQRDSEVYHERFDTLLEDKLRELDPEWIEAMLSLYEESGAERWYA